MKETLLSFHSPSLWPIWRYLRRLAFFQGSRSPHPYRENNNHRRMACNWQDSTYQKWGAHEICLL